MSKNQLTLIKPKITWITPDYFVDCDFNPGIFLEVLRYYDVYWIVLLPAANARFTELEFEVISKLPGLKVEFIYWTSRARSPKMLLFFNKVYRRIKELKSDLVYFNYVPENPYVLPLYWLLNKRKTIVTAHDGNVKSSFSMPWLSKAVFNMAFNTVSYVNMFSPTQALLFKAGFSKPQLFIIPLGLKDFGSANIPKVEDNVVFLFFGSIHSNKNLELLINAACNLYDKGLRGFKVSIHGYTPNWSVYASQIKYPELFECDIRLHKNVEIPGLFSQSHYVVFPYRELSQSGALKVAFNYNVPVIVSNLEGFTDEVEDGVNGFVFESENVKDLERVMSTCLQNHETGYETLNKNIIQYNNDHYATEVLGNKYLHMFNHVLTSA